MTGNGPVHVERHDGVLVARLSGAIDPSNAAGVEADVLEAVTTASGGFVVDLTAVTFLDSAGVRFLDHVLAARGPDIPLLVVAEQEGSTRFTLRICGFPEDLLRDDLAVAVSELGAASAG